MAVVASGIARKLQALLIVLLLINGMGYAQSQTDIDALLDKAKELQSVNLDSALLLARKAHTQSVKTRYMVGQSKALLRLGSVMNWQARNDSAAYFLRACIHLRSSISDNAGVASALRMLSAVQLETAKVDSAFESLFLAEKEAQKSNDSAVIAGVWVDLGNAYMTYGEAEQALGYFENALAVSDRLHLDENRSLAMDGLARYYMSAGMYEDALKTLVRLDTYFTGAGDDVARAFTQINIALCLAKLDRPAASVAANKEALHLFEDLDMRQYTCIISDNLARNFLAENLLDSAFHYARSALRDAEEIADLRMQVAAHETLAEVYVQRGRFDLAFDHQLILTQLNDSILNEEKVSSISRMNAIYQTEKKEQQIALLDEQNRTKTAQRNFFIAGSAVLLLTLVGLAFVFFQRRKLARKDALIAQQRIATLLNEQEINTYNAMIEGQEEERKRISRDLHDRLGGMLSTVKLLFQSLDEKIDKHQQENKKQLSKVTELIDDAVVEVRRISHDLNTGVVANFGLIAALEDLCESIDQNSAIRCRLLVYGMESRLGSQVEIGIYRMVQEVINNILKHAEASRVTVQVNKTDDAVSVTIEDDGKGFDVGAPGKRDGIGLSNLGMRAERLGGTYHIDSTPGRGTISIIEIPLTENRA